MIKRILLLLILMSLGFIVYRIFDPVGADNILYKLKDLPNNLKFWDNANQNSGDIVDIENDSGNNLIITGNTIKVEINDLGIEKNKIEENEADYLVEKIIVDENVKGGTGDDIKTSGTVEDTAVEDTVVEDTVVEDIVVEDTAVEDTDNNIVTNDSEQNFLTKEDYEQAKGILNNIVK